eukprot:12110_1
MLLSFVVFVSYVIIHISNGTMLVDTAIIHSKRGISVSINTETDTNTATLIVTGSPIPNHFVIQFFDSYSIHFNKNETTINIEEHLSHIILLPMISISDHKTIDRFEILKLKRNRIGISSIHYTFPNTTSHINMSWLFKSNSYEITGRNDLYLQIFNATDTCKTKGEYCNNNTDCCQHFKCSQNICKIKKTDVTSKSGLILYMVSYIVKKIFCCFLWFSIAQHCVLNIVMHLCLFIKTFRVTEQTLFIVL